MDANTGDVVGTAVQVGDPITEKGCIEVVERARDQRLYNAITDCGAGGFSSSVGEMGEDLGVEVDLSGVLLKYPGLQPWEIWLSEAQERIVLAVPSVNLPLLADLCEQWDVELTDLGEFTGDHRLVVRHGDLGVVDIPMEFLHDGLPRREMHGEWSDPAPSDGSAAEFNSELLLEMLAHPDVASNEDIVRRYDHEVRGGTVVRPMVGPHADGPSDAAVIKPLGTSDHPVAAVVSNGICPRLGLLDSPMQWHCRPSTRQCAIWWLSEAIPIAWRCSTTSAGATPRNPTASVALSGPLKDASMEPGRMPCPSSPGKTACSTSSTARPYPVPF